MFVKALYPRLAFEILSHESRSCVTDTFTLFLDYTTEIDGQLNYKKVKNMFPIFIFAQSPSLIILLDQNSVHQDFHSIYLVNRKKLIALEHIITFEQVE